jgi:hypothetical protein
VRVTPVYDDTGEVVAEEEVSEYETDTSEEEPEPEEEEPPVPAPAATARDIDVVMGDGPADKRYG